MNRILAAATLALMVGTSSLVSAQAATAELKPYTMDMSSDMRASKIIGQRIYATLNDVEGRTLTQTELAEFDDIGEVDDVILSPSGEVKAVVLGVGGFLGLGERDVTVDMSSLRFVKETDGEGTFIVVNAGKDRLTALAEEQKMALADEAEAVADVAAAQTADAVETTGEAVEKTGEAVEGAAETVVTETAEAVTATGEAAEKVADKVAAEVEETTKTVEIETAEAAPPTTEREVLVRPQVVTEGYEDVATSALTTDDLTGKRVYGADGEDVGEVSELVMGADGTTIERAVLDVGGFLGLGERKVAVPLDELQFQRNADGDMRVYIQATQQQLEAQPEYVAE